MSDNHNYRIDIDGQFDTLDPFATSILKDKNTRKAVKIDRTTSAHELYLSHDEEWNEFCNNVDKELKPIHRIKLYYILFFILFISINPLIFSFVINGNKDDNDNEDNNNNDDDYIQIYWYSPFIWILLGLGFGFVIVLIQLILLFLGYLFYVRVIKEIILNVKDKIQHICEEQNNNDVHNNNDSNNNNYIVRYELGDEPWDNKNGRNEVGGARRFFIIIYVEQYQQQQLPSEQEEVVEEQEDRASVVELEPESSLVQPPWSGID